MASPSYYADGSPGSGTPTISISAVTYVAENITINRPVVEAEDFTLVGKPNRKRVVALRANGTCTIQADAGSSGKPKMGDTFSLTVDDNFGAETWVIKEVPFEASNDGGSLRKYSITFDKVINSITVTA